MDDIELGHKYADYRKAESKYSLPVPTSERACLAAIHIMAAYKIKEAICDHQRPDIEWFKIMQCVEQIVPEWKDIEL